MRTRRRTIRFTDASVRSVPPGASGERLDYFDEGTVGLCLRVSGSGVRTFAVWYRFGDSARRRARRHTIGRYPVITLKDAREEARRIVSSAVLGRDPAPQPVAPVDDGEPFLSVIAAFLEAQEGVLAPRTHVEYRRALEHDVPTAMRETPVGLITRGQVRQVVADVASRAPVQANRTFAAIRRVFNWALEQDRIAASPCLGLKPQHRERPKDRVYSNDELRRIVAGAASTPLHDVLTVLLYTGVRSEEARSARWSDIDLPRHVWHIPAGRSKNREAHPVPLTRPVVEVLMRRARVSEWVFPGIGSSGFLTQPKRSVAQIRRSSGVVDFTPHDVRRTVATRLAEAGTPDSVIEAILGHTVPRLKRTYNRYTPLAEMTRALERWSLDCAVLLGPAHESERLNVGAT